MKKAVNIVLIIWAVLATFLLIMSCVAYNENDAEWAAKVKEHDSRYQELLTKEQENFAKDMRFLGIRAAADCVTEKNVVCEVSEETVLVVLHSEGRSWRTMLDKIDEHIVDIKTMLELSSFSKEIIMVVDDAERVAFGFSVDSKGVTGDFRDNDLIK